MLLQQLVNGLTLGAVYTLVALGFSLVMGVLGILNLAVAELFMLGGYVGLTLMLDGQPLLVGASRKRMIGALSGEAPADRRLGGSLALAVKAADAGVQLLRVHDVAETVQALRVWRGLRDAALTDFSQLPA